MGKRGPKAKDKSERFWRMVKKTELCWLWTGALNLGKNKKGGYGKFMVKKVNGRGVFEASHRWAYRHYIGAIPPGAMVLHRCDNRACVRPDHLFLGSNQDNVNDMIVKGRHGGPRGESHPKAKLTYEDITKIRKLYSEDGLTQKQIAAEFSVDRSSISRIVRGKQWVRASASCNMLAVEAD